MAKDDPSNTEQKNNSSNKATNRLDQLSSHLSPSPKEQPQPRTKKQRQKSSSSSSLPADYSDILSQLSTLRTLAATPDPTSRGYVRQKQAGKLWVRERIEQLLDQGSFKEIGSVTGTVTWKQSTTGPGSGPETPISFTPSNNIQGTGKLRGRQVLLTADDFSIRGGHADGAIMEKTIYLEKMAIAMKLPVVKLVDGSSGGGSVTTIRKEGWSYIPYVSSLRYAAKQLNMGIPNLGAVVGPAV